MAAFLVTLLHFGGVEISWRHFLRARHGRHGVGISMLSALVSQIHISVLGCHFRLLYVQSPMDKLIEIRARRIDSITASLSLEFYYFIIFIHSEI